MEKLLFHRNISFHSYRKIIFKYPETVSSLKAYSVCFFFHLYHWPFRKIEFWILAKTSLLKNECSTWSNNHHVNCAFCDWKWCLLFLWRHFSLTKVFACFQRNIASVLLDLIDFRGRITVKKKETNEHISRNTVENYSLNFFLL